MGKPRSAGSFGGRRSSARESVSGPGKLHPWIRRLVTRLARSAQTLSISSEEEPAFELATSMASRRRVLIQEYSNARP